MPPLTVTDVLMFLYVVVAVMLVVVLYHVLFIAADLRKIVRRINDVTEELESVLMKPISMVDQILQWVLERVQKKHRKREKKSETKP
ncbi:hypothetical protein HY285_04810 [Candidatus Peregrinibacteria bacterium]|nr:hypothetical protein [Candidatus Peregrinibacteria bacterium]MBI3816832.1 hypothetical protein [Candidatus Peregrinibacteria bacterium]